MTGGGCVPHTHAVMDVGARGALHGEARVRFVAQPSSVPAVRAWLSEVLLGRWDGSSRLDDVLLAATELAANAMLHSGGTSFEVAVSVDDTGLRLLVEDAGTAPAGAIAHRSEQAVVSTDEPEAESTTGRGLFMVSALATAWGIEELESGTRIWADFSPGAGDYTPRSPQVRAGQGRAERRGVRIIELRGCPPDLLLAHDANLADTARELRLFGATHGDTRMVEAAEQIAEVVRLSAVSWDAARIVAHQAVRDGVPEVDIATAPTEWDEVPGRVAVLRRAVGLAEDMMERGLLMTLPAPAPVQEWRDWVEGEMVEQVTLGREPVRFADWRRRRG